MTTKVASFKATPLERDIITVIVERAIIEGICLRGNAMNLNMDITAAHANGCPLDLAKLAVARPNHFGHDLAGICRNIDRITGELKGGFLPRYAKHQEAA